MKDRYLSPNFRRLLWTATALICICHPPYALAQYTATVDVNTRYQKFEGFGTSLAWWASVIGGYPDPVRADYVTKFFDPVEGLGLSIVRYNIGGGENPKYLPPNKPYLQFRARVPGFATSLGQYDWSQDVNQRYVLTAAMQKGVTIAEAFSNSPPYWMTISGSVSGGENAADNLKESEYGNFADYLTTVVKHFRDDWGITFRTVTGLNEPASKYWHLGNRQEGCGFMPVNQVKIVKQLGASLAAKSMAYTSVSAPEETDINQSVVSLPAYDKAAKAYVTQYNTHTYKGNQRTQFQALAAADHKRIWMSETGDGDASGLTMARGMLADLREMKANAWIYWQAVDNARGWGFFVNPLDGSERYEYTVNQKYYVMANFSKFIRPGFQFVVISDANSVAAVDGSGKAVIVTVSQSKSPQTVTYQLSNMGPGQWQATPYRTSETEKLARLPSLPVSGNHFAYDIPALSVTTFVLTKQ